MNNEIISALQQHANWHNHYTLTIQIIVEAGGSVYNQLQATFG